LSKIPFGADQPFNGDRVYTSGLGPKPIKIKNLNLENLTAAIAELSRDKEMKAKAVQASEIIKKETGVQSTVDIINDILENGHEVYLQKLREKYNKDYW
jgi:UDP:flavonoid glycosyltransferase YjiC (YdhE family)